MEGLLFGIALLFTYKICERILEIIEAKWQKEEENYRESYTDSSTEKSWQENTKSDGEYREIPEIQLGFRPNEER